MIRVILPDSHGQYIDKKAEKAVLADIKRLNPSEIIMLGDHVDCSGIFSHHPKQTIEDLEYSYYKDIGATNYFLDGIQDNAPNATIDYLEGNHEGHVTRWAVETCNDKEDAKFLIENNAPEYKLRLKERGIKYYSQTGFYQGLSIPNTIKRGKCYFTHGITACKHAASVHLDKFGDNVVFGHTHRAQSHLSRTVKSGAIGAWCPGTLSQLQPAYLHTMLSSWTTGYAIQDVSKSGLFLHVNVSIINGKSLLPDDLFQTQK